jgi:hypothetical protein
MGSENMKTVAFDGHLNPDSTISVPPEVAAALGDQKSVGVVLVFADDPHERDWRWLTGEQFLRGYAAEDAIYDEL